MSQESCNPYMYAELQNTSRDLYANAKFDLVERYLRGSSPLRLLEIGCGAGELSLRLGASGHDVLGVDAVPEYISIAEESRKKLGIPTCRFATVPLEELAEVEPFDCVVATDVLEHIEDDRTALESMVRLVKPGGTVLLTVPAGPWLYGWHDRELGHFRRYTRTSFRKLVEGLCVVDDVRYFGFTLIPACLLYSRVLQKPYPVSTYGDAKANPVLSGLLQGVLRLEQSVRLPLGTSVILKGTRT